LTAVLVVIASAAWLGGTASGAFAHQDGCHSAHSCPSDHHTYVWYDGGGQGWDCVEPGAPEYDPSRDTTTIVYDGRTYYCRPAGAAPPPPPPDADGDGVPDGSDACPRVAARTADGCPLPAPPDSDGDGITDNFDDCPFTPAGTDDGCPAPAPIRVFVGAIGSGSFASRWTDRLQRPRRLVPCSGDGNCQVIGTRWRNWGKTTASGRGTAKVNDCLPNCALGHFRKFRGARVLAYRRRDGACKGEAVRYYTRVRVTWPRQTHLPRETLKLSRTCKFRA
jgi:hypothetical protein